MKTWLITLSMLVPSLALAHPGHGSTPPSSVAHYLVEPEHSVLLLVAVVAAALIFLDRRLRRV